jgi:hypothetical protein
MDAALTLRRMKSKYCNKSNGSSNNNHSRVASTGEHLDSDKHCKPDKPNQKHIQVAY